MNAWAENCPKRAEIRPLRTFVNAFFISAPFGPQGTGMLAFGQTDDEVPLVPLDIAAHELMHGVTYSALTERTGLRFGWRSSPSCRRRACSTRYALWATTAVTAG